MVIEHAPLEDELGDVLDKAIRLAGLTEAALAARTGIDRERIADAIAYRYDLTSDEWRTLAAALSLNEVGVLALASGRYPLPRIAGLPFCLYPLRMQHGIGVSNAYIAADCGQEHGVLFDTGGSTAALRRVWPAIIDHLDAIFITNTETEHLAGLADLRERFNCPPVFAPAGCAIEGATGLAEGARLTFDTIEVETLSTPGHTEEQNCYLVRSTRACKSPPLVIPGDLLFAGSIGAAFYCSRRLKTHLARLMALPPESIVAPGHGPFTTIGNERTCNPFVK